MLSALLTPLGLLPLVVPPQAPEAPAQEKRVEPEWIWTAEGTGEDQHVWFFHAFEARGAIESAMLWGSCDNAFELNVNGRRTAVGEEWSLTVRRDITSSLKGGGRNQLAVHARNDGGPAGFWLELEIEYSDGTEERILSDESWLVTSEEHEDWGSAGFAPGAWPTAVSLGELGVEPWGSPTGTIDGLPPRALSAKELEIPEGFVAELVYSVPRASQGSWVSMTPAPGGRLFTSDQYGGIYRVTPAPFGAPSSRTIVEPVEIEIGQAQGMLWAFDSLYIVGGTGGGEAGLYRATDGDGDGRLDQVQLLRALNGSGEHGPHAVLLAPGGESLYVIAGNHTTLPETDASRVPRVWDEDQLLPREPDPRGHAQGVLAPGGWICEIDPRGESWTLVACGMRNAYDAALNADGELFTFDSDMEWDVGLPWYRPTRVCHLVSGADFGWRNGSGKWPVTYPDSWPGTCDLGLSSPTGVLFAPGSFPAEWRDSFLVADWAYGTIYAVDLREEGASYTGTSRVFVRGKPLPVTDLAVGEDGAVYITTGGRRLQSGLYRVRWGGGNTQLSLVESTATGAGGASRALRHELESGHLGATGTEIDFIWEHLDAADPFVRRAARVALEMRPVDEWAQRALAEEEPARALYALLALARVGDEGHRVGLLEAWLELPTEDFDEARRIDSLRVAGLIAIRLGKFTAAEGTRVLGRVDSLYPTGSFDLDRELATLLVALEAPQVVERTLGLLDSAETQSEQIFYLFVLRNLDANWTAESRETYFAVLQRAIATFTGGASLTAYLSGARESAIELLSPEEAEPIASLLIDLPSAPSGEIVPASFVRSWTMADLEADLETDWSTRDLERGNVLLERTRCLECHRVNNDGGNTGPDLTGTENRLNARDLLEAILDPSSQISDQYQDTEILTFDDELFVGSLAGETEDTVTLKTLPPEEELYDFDRREIQLQRPHALSRMPNGLLDVLEREEVLDLLAVLLVDLR